MSQRTVDAARPGDAGRATVEAVALAAVLIAVLAVLATSSTVIGDRFSEAVRTLLCRAAAVVTGQACPGVSDHTGEGPVLGGEPVPCLTEQSGRRTRAFGSFGPVTVGLSSESQMNVFDDGSVEMVLLGGGDGALGRSLDGKKTPGMPDWLQVSLEGRQDLHAGHQFRFDQGTLEENLAAARTLLERAHGDGLGSRTWRLLPGTRDYEAAERVGRVERSITTVSANARMRGDGGGIGGGGLGGAYDTTVAYDDDAGEATVTLELDGDLAGRLGDEFLARGTGGGEHARSYTIVYDTATGEPLRITRTVTSAAGGGVDLGPEMEVGDDTIRIGGGGEGRRVRTREQHLDLAHPDARAAFDQVFFSRYTDQGGPIVFPKARFAPLHEQFTTRGLELRQDHVAVEGGPDNDWIFLGGHDLHRLMQLQEAWYIDHQISPELQPWDCFG